MLFAKSKKATKLNIYKIDFHYDGISFVKTMIDDGWCGHSTTCIGGNGFAINIEELVKIIKAQAKIDHKERQKANKNPTTVFEFAGIQICDAKQIRKVYSDPELYPHKQTNNFISTADILIAVEESCDEGDTFIVVAE